MESVRTTAIVLAAGQGRRMNSSVPKQFLLIKDKPVLYYSLKVFEDSFIDDIILVVGSGGEAFCRREILQKYNLTKVRAVIEGGRERYHSVSCGLRGITWPCDYVFIHDGARPFIDEAILQRALCEVKLAKACVTGMPVKDTVKIADAKGYVADTPARSMVWQIQTPQVFERSLIAAAYEKLLSEEQALLAQGVDITDDAMVVEYFTQIPVKLVEGSYRNIKITTPEDIEIAPVFLEAAARGSKNFFS
ncbi:MAG: 2-C-methyl-D-erythritol 4-phosphate cytidylyltransferase [Roseburia sp.]|nr:2-C-methyl-D-erythritol 4-phosphate cytidylyltransferase [Roseburia sp.]